jgi:Amt family ammonium transporter
MTFILFKIVDKLVGLRVTAGQESNGLDISMHGEIAYHDGE